MSETAGILKSRLKKNSSDGGVLLPTTDLMSSIFLLDFVTRKAIFDALAKHGKFQFANPNTLHNLRTQVYLTNVKPDNTESGVSVGFKKLIDASLQQYEELAVKALNEKRDNGTDEVTVSVPMGVLEVRRFMITFVCMIDLLLRGGGNNYHERFAGNQRATSQGIYASNHLGATSNNEMHMFGNNHDAEINGAVQSLKDDQNDRIVIAYVNTLQEISGITANEKKIVENIDL